MFIFVASLFLHNRTVSDNCYDVQNVLFGLSFRVLQKMQAKNKALDIGST